jgi:GMP synthase-like glutamine amidotransferase
MRPVAILRHAPTEGPGHFATYLSRNGIPWHVVKIDEGEPVPQDAAEYSGFALMGGPMSVNDDLPWIAPVLSLIRGAVATDIPVIGHCLGAQLLAKALGGAVTRNPVKEIGWGIVDVIDSAEARLWFGDEAGSFPVFHWHGETFSIPAGATRVLASAHCANQAFVRGRHLGLQCHVEMTPELVRAWCADWGKEVGALARRTVTVQTPEQMTAGLEERTRALNIMADRIYDRWSQGLARD